MLIQVTELENTVDNQQQINLELSSQNTILTNRVEALSGKEAVPWEIREKAYIRDHGGSYQGKCPCCRKRLRPFRPNSIHAGHIIPENFITNNPRLSIEEKNKIKKALITEDNIIMICFSCNSAHKCDMRDYVKEELEDNYDEFMQSHSVQFEALEKLLEEYGLKEEYNNWRKENQ